MTSRSGCRTCLFNLRVDPLAGFFLMLLGSVSAGISSTPRAISGGGLGAPALIGCQYHVFLASMAFVLLADDAYLFMVAWETMALASYFLVITDHKQPAIRSAGFLYLSDRAPGGDRDPCCASGCCTAGARLLVRLRCARRSSSPRGRPWHSCSRSSASGQGGDAPAPRLAAGGAPRGPFAGVGADERRDDQDRDLRMVRVIFESDRQRALGRGAGGMLVIGAVHILFGVLYALMQHDLKRLLAYHSVENIGIILLGLGMAMVFIGFGHRVAGTLGLIAGLYHTLNHAVFKALLFLGAGRCLHSTGLRNLNDMGGLIHRMRRRRSIS